MDYIVHCSICLGAFFVKKILVWCMASDTSAALMSF